MNKNLMYIIITLIAVIAVAMMFSGKQPEEMADSASESMNEAADAVSEAGQQAMEDASESTEEIGDDVKEATDDAMDSMKETGDNLEQKASDMMNGNNAEAIEGSSEETAAEPVPADQPVTDENETGQTPAPQEETPANQAQ